MLVLTRVLGGALQLGSGFIMFREGSVAVVLGLHLLGTLVWSGGIGVVHRPSDWRRGALAFVFALMLPGVGWVISLLVEKIVGGEPPQHEKRALLVWRDRNVRDNFQLRANMGPRASVAEILRGPDPASRRNAILAVNELDVRAALPLLRKGLQDSDEQVRIFAQNSLSELLEKFESRIKSLEARSQRRPADVNTAIGLAEQYFELVYLDVAGDEETDAHFLGKAVDLLSEAAQNEPENSRVALLQLRYALRQRNCDLAAAALARVKAMQVDEQVVLPWEVELAFVQRDWRRVKQLLQSFLDKRLVNPRIEAIANYWNRREVVK